MNKKSREKSNTANTIETFINDENIRSLLASLNIGTSHNIYIIKETSHNPINKSILIEIPDDSCTGEIPILLNVKKGQPTVDQVYNAIYQHGADCQKQIIAFTGGNFLDDKFNPSADVDTVKCLVEAMNRFDRNIYLVQMVYDSTSSTCNYEVLTQPDRHAKFSTAEYPSKEKFTEAEFWEVYFWGYNNWVEATPFEFGFDSNSEFSQCFPIGDLELETKWTDEGSIIRIEDTNHNNKNELDAIWNAMKSDILNMFRGSAMELLIQAGETFKLIVKVFDKPIGDLAGVPWREKIHYAGLLWSKFIQIQGFLEKALQDQINNSEEIFNGKT